MVALHLLENLKCKVRLLVLDIGTNCSVKEGSGGEREARRWMEKVVMKDMTTVSSNEGEKKRFGIRELVVSKETREEGEE